MISLISSSSSSFVVVVVVCLAFYVVASEADRLPTRVSSAAGDLQGVEKGRGRREGDWVRGVGGCALFVFIRALMCGHWPCMFVCVCVCVCDSVIVCDSVCGDRSQNRSLTKSLTTSSLAPFAPFCHPHPTSPLRTTHRTSTSTLLHNRLL